AGTDRNLLPNLEGGRERLGEDSRLVGDAGGHLVQVRERQREALREGAVTAADAEHVAPLAVRPAAGEARRAPAAGHVDLAHYPPSHPFLGAHGGLDASHELVAGDARERVVAAHELEIGVAD